MTAVVRGGHEVLVRDRDRRGYLIAKRLFDLAVCLAALPVVVPLLGLIALAIRLDSPGPIVFRQQRTGRHGVRFGMYKFRTMVRNAEELKASLAHLNILPPPDFKIPDDPRITRVGRILRKTSLDELPQFFNVVKGDLSLVGPRPHALKAKAADKLYADAVDGYFARHRVKPGVTGWAQINGWRGETDTQEKILRRVEHDLFYIENWSVTFDLYILLMTPIALLKGDNAY